MRATILVLLVMVLLGGCFLDPSHGDDRDTSSPLTEAADGYQPKIWFGCHTLIQIGGADVFMGYSGTHFSNRDTLVDCEIGSRSQDSSRSSYFPNFTVGADSAACTVALDMPPMPSGVNNVGIWLFELSEQTPLGPRATYRDDDPGHPLNGFTRPFANAECQFSGFRMGSWTPISLAEIRVALQ